VGIPPSERVLTDELLIIKLFASVKAAQVLAVEYQMDYNVYRLHAALHSWRAA
jgi:hypothetical protein